MIVNDLYFIGNGFDLYHKIKCRFSDYGEWIKQNNPSLYFRLNDIYNICDEEDWNQFETLLGELKVYKIAQEICNERYPTFKVTDTDRDWDDKRRDYEASIDEAEWDFEELYYDIKNTFENWVKSLNQPDENSKIDLRKDNSYFISFNYTDTLESLYHISSNQILYLHGCAKKNEELILGHGLSEQQIRQRERPHRQQKTDEIEQSENWGEEQGDYIQDETFETILNKLVAQRKPIEQIIHNLYPLLSNLKHLNHIHIYGFSFSNIDLPYIQYIANKVKKMKVEWEVSYFKTSECKLFHRKLLKLGISKDSIKMAKLSKLQKSKITHE